MRVPHQFVEDNCIDGLSIAWVDINLTVTPDTISLIFSLLSDPSLNIRLATCTVINRIVNKGLKVSSDKVKLLQVLSLGPVLDQLEQKTSLTTDDPIQSFRDALARVTNSLGEQLVVLCSDVSNASLSHITLNPAHF